MIETQANSLKYYPGSMNHERTATIDDIYKTHTCYACGKTFGIPMEIRYNILDAVNKSDDERALAMFPRFCPECEKHKDVGLDVPKKKDE